MPPQSVRKMRLGRLADERERTNEKLGDLIQNAEDEQRDLGEFENEQIAKYRTRIEELDVEIELLAGDLERDSKTRDVSALLRDDQRTAIEIGPNGPVVYRTFAAYARDEMIARWPQLARMAVTQQSDVPVIQEQARERLMRVQNTLTSDVAGLLPPTHLTEIMDIISGSRPVVTSARGVPLTSGQLTYPRITGRPSVTKQTSEKTEAGTAKMSVVMDTMNAETYLGGGDLSWQTINWGTPDALQLWFTLAAEAYARATETRACNELGTASGGTISTPLGTTGTESFDAWRAAILAGLRTIYANTGGRQQSNTLWVAANRFFALAGTGTANVLQTSSVGQLDIATMTGVYSGLRVIGSYGFADNTAVIGDSGAFLVGETPGAPVELRVVEPAIGGMECGVIGAFQCKVFDTNRFIHLS